MTTFVEEKLSEQSFSIGKNNTSIPKQWQVITTDFLTELEVSQLPELPKIGDAYPDDSLCKVDNVSGQKYQSNGKDIWDIVVVYSKNTSSENTFNTDNNNTGSPKLVGMSHSYRAIEKALEKSYKPGEHVGNPSIPVVNTAGQKFTNPITAYKYNSVLRWTQRMDSKPNAKSYLGTVNSGGVTILGESIPARQGLLRTVSPTLVRDEDDKLRYDVTFEVEVDQEEHKIQARNIGYKFRRNNELVDIRKGHISPNLINSTDEKEQEEADEPVDEPQDLSSDGGIGNPSKPVYLDFYPHGASSWGGLNMLSRIT